MAIIVAPVESVAWKKLSPSNRKWSGKVGKYHLYRNASPTHAMTNCHLIVWLDHPDAYDFKPVSEVMAEDLCAKCLGLFEAINQ